MYLIIITLYITTNKETHIYTYKYMYRCLKYCIRYTYKCLFNSFFARCQPSWPVEVNGSSCWMALLSSCRVTRSATITLAKVSHN